MAYPAVPNTFTGGTSLDPSQLNNNYVSLLQGLTDGQKDHDINSLTVANWITANGDAFIGSSGSVIEYAEPAVGMYQSPTQCMVWKDTATITMQAGDYWIAGAVYNLSANLDWTWTSAAQNLGLDTGSEAVSTWYYLYAVVSGSAFAVIASATAPTALINTAITGHTVTTYLGAFYNDSGGDIMAFTRNKNMMVLTAPATITSSEAGGTVDISAYVPETANRIFGVMSTTAGDDAEIYTDSDGDLILYDAGYSSWGGATDYGLEMFFDGEIEVAQSLYVTIDGTAKLRIQGWYDKWLR
jgi:hypothetical protein